MLSRIKSKIVLLWEAFIEAQEMRAKARAKDVIRRYGNNDWL